MIRIQFAVTEKKSGRATKWDERKVGDYSAASMALLAVAMGDDDFRRAVVALAEERLPGVSTFVDPESGTTVGMAWPAGEKPVVALDCPDMTEAEFIADPANAIMVSHRWDPKLTDEQNVFAILARSQHGPDTMAIQAVGFANLEWVGEQGGHQSLVPVIAPEAGGEGFTTQSPREFKILVWDRMGWLKARPT